VALTFGFIQFRNEANNSKTKFKRPDRSSSLVLKTKDFILLGLLRKVDLQKTEKEKEDMQGSHPYGLVVRYKTFST